MKKRTKKRIKIILILLALLMIYRRYCVMNVMDEMILSDQSFLFIPYTRASYPGNDIEYEFAGRPFLDGTWTSDPDLKMIFYYEREGGKIRFYRYKWKMKMIVYLPDSGTARFSAGWKYNVWSKKLSSYVKAEELIGIKNGKKVWEFIDDAETAEAYTRKSGMSVEEIYERAEAEMKKFLDEWVQTNEGKSRFSEGHYGWYREGELEYCWENEYAEWF